MYRKPLLALLPLVLAVPALALETHSAAGPPVHLETVAVKIMFKAFEFGDYDTVETLFEKLPLENKKQFLHKAAETATVNVFDVVTKSGGDLAAVPFIDMKYMFMFAMLQIEEIKGEVETRVKVGEFASQILETYANAKTEQTQLLGHLTASLLEESAVAASSAKKEYYAVIIQTEFNEWWAKREEKIPFNGYDDVLDALGDLTLKNGSFVNRGTKGWVERPRENGEILILPIDFVAMGNGNKETNHRLRPNDRLVVIPHVAVAADLIPAEPVSLTTAVKDIWQSFWR